MCHIAILGVTSLADYLADPMLYPFDVLGTYTGHLISDPCSVLRVGPQRYRNPSSARA